MDNSYNVLRIKGIEFLPAHNEGRNSFFILFYHKISLKIDGYFSWFLKNTVELYCEIVVFLTAFMSGRLILVRAYLLLGGYML